MMDAEAAHHLALAVLKLSSNMPGYAGGFKCCAKKLWGVHFLNPLGLAAGFDKNGECLFAWQRLGFGFVEVGTVTALPQAGNPKPRLFRLPKDGALLNRLGFNNQGADQVAHNLEKQKRNQNLVIPIGINIGKSKVAPLEEAAQDYLKSFRALADLSDYMVINVSSPNTPGLRNLQETDALKNLLHVLCSENQKRQTPKPLLVKLAPDLHIEDAIKCTQVAVDFNLAGLVISNTTIARDNLTDKIPEGPGGISGKPLFEKSTCMLKDLHAAFKNKLNFIGVGGVTDAETAKAKLENGADLLQAYTGFIYQGPFFVKKVLRNLR